MSFIAALTAFGLITLAMLGLEIMVTYMTQGFKYGFSSNRAGVERSPLPLRIQRAYQNQIESAAYGVPILATAAISGLQFSGVETAALLFVVGRAAFAVLYYSGINFIRLPAFLLANLSLVYIAYGLIVTIGF